MAIWRRKGRSTPTADLAPPTNVPPATGFMPSFDPQWSLGDMSFGAADRTSTMTELLDAYLACPWANAAVDLVARTISAGGVYLRPRGQTHTYTPPVAKKLTGPMLGLQRLIDYPNPHQDMGELMRQVLVDYLVFGDAFLEVVYLLGEPVALYHLDSPTTVIQSDAHGQILGYKQVLDQDRTATFSRHEVIHISAGGPRNDVYGTSAIRKAILPITAWLFTAALLKELMRKGNPPTRWIDYPAEADAAEITRDRQQYLSRIIGLRNVGNPFVTKGGVKLQELQPNQIPDLIQTLNNLRDQIVSTIGVPGRKLGIIEPGSLGGTGTEAWQDKTFEVNTCAPPAATVLNALNDKLTRRAFGILDHELVFGRVDWRDDAVVANIISQRLRDGIWTLNRARAEVGEPPVKGGDVAVLVNRQNFVDWADVEALSKAMLATAQAGGAAAVSKATGMAVPPITPPKAPTVPEPKAPSARPEEQFLAARDALLAEMIANLEDLDRSEEEDTDA